MIISKVPAFYFRFYFCSASFHILFPHPSLLAFDWHIQFYVGFDKSSIFLVVPKIVRMDLACQIKVMVFGPLLHFFNGFPVYLLGVSLIDRVGTAGK